MGVTDVAGKLFHCFIVVGKKLYILKIGSRILGNSKEFGVTISRVSRKWYEFFKKIDSN